MKKFILLIFILSISILICGCDMQSNNQQSSTINNSLKNYSNSENIKNSEDIIKALMKENLNCVNNIFMNGSLESDDILLKDNIYEVKTNLYKNYSEFEKYINSVYNSEISDMLLNNYPYENDSKYINVNGKLCINKDHDSPKGYFINWNNYKIVINHEDDEKVDFTLIAKREEPSDERTSEEYKVQSTMSNIDGKWKLDKIIY